MLRMEVEDDEEDDDKDEEEEDINDEKGTPEANGEETGTCTCT